MLPEGFQPRFRREPETQVVEVTSVVALFIPQEVGIGSQEYVGLPHDHKRRAAAYVFAAGVAAPCRSR